MNGNKAVRREPVLHIIRPQCLSAQFFTNFGETNFQPNYLGRNTNFFAMYNPQYITDEKGNKLSVVVPIHEYKKLMEELEELEDIRLYDEVKSRNETSIPFDEYIKQRKQRKNA